MNTDTSELIENVKPNLEKALETMIKVSEEILTNNFDASELDYISETNGVSESEWRWAREDSYSAVKATDDLIKEITNYINELAEAKMSIQESIEELRINRSN